MSKCLFGVALGVLAMEMVLAYARPSHSCCCRVLVMWALLTPLDHFEDFIHENLVPACQKVHEEWGIREPSETCAMAYDFDEWKNQEHLQLKATQNARGSNGEVILDFISRRRLLDKVIEGDGVQDAYLFEGLSRAHLRHHVFVEDLRANEELPFSLQSEGMRLGLHSRQFVNKPQDAASRQSL